MTALPRSPIDVPTNPAQIHNAATGRQSQNHPSQLGGGETGGDIAKRFSSLLGKAGAQVEAPVKQKLPQAQPQTQSHDIDTDLIIGQPDGAANVPNLPLASSGSQVTPMRAHTLDLNFGTSRIGEGLQHTASAARSGVAASVLPIATTGSVGEVAQLAAIKQQIVKPAQPDGVILRSEKMTTPQGDGSLVPPRGESAGTTVVAPPGSAVVDQQSQMGQAVTTRSDLGTLRVDNGAAQKDRLSDRGKPVADAERPNAKELPRLDLMQPSAPSKPAAIPVEPASTSPQVLDPVGVSPNGSSPLSSSTSDNAGDLPRLQEVKVVGTRVIEMAPATLDRSGQGTTVKVIDLQLQPDTLGRIGAQLKQTGGVLEVRLEPSMAETAVLLKEDRLALQRILGSLGSISESTVVRIVDPIGEQKLEEGQDSLAGSEPGETNTGGGWSTTSGDLQGEGYGNDGYQDRHISAEQDDMLHIDRQHASGDIYI